MSAFVWGKNGEKLTPEDVERQRLASAMMYKQGADFSPAGHWSEALGRAFNGWASGRINKIADKGEKEGLAGADERIAAILSGQGGGFGGSGPVPSYTASTAGQVAPGVVAPGPVSDPAAALGADAMAALGKPPVAAAGHDHATHAGQTHADWLKYSNAGATRNDPLDPTLIDAMSFLPDLGVTMDVISGGQEPAGTPGGSRTGSTRHDHGKAADADFYKDGRKLDWNNPADLPLLAQIVQTAKANGVTGIGAGDDYMGPGRFHVGFGNPGVWGAGGKSANAPAWLVDAYNGAPLGSAPSGGPATYEGPAGTGAAVSSGGMGGLDIASLLALQSDPWVAKKYGGVVDALLGQQFSRQNALWEQEQRMADPMYQAQLAELTAPKVSDYDARAAAAAQYGLQPGTPEYQRFVLAGDVAVAGGGMPDAPETQVFFDEATGQEYRAQWNGQEWVRIGGTKAPSGPLVENNINPDGTPNDDALRKKLMEAEGVSWAESLKAGATSSGMQQDMDLLDQAIELAPTGPVQGRLAEMFPGVSDAAGVFQSVVKRIAPSLRVEGSGSQSDIEYNGFLQSLPALSNRPEANRAIARFLRAKAQVNMDRAAVIAAYQNGEKSDTETRKALQEIDSRSIMTPELNAALGGIGGEGASAPTAVPTGIDPADWEFMTPEERALFQ